MIELPAIKPLPFHDGDSLRKWQLIEDWYFQFDNIKVFIPKGFITDFASIPVGLRSLYDPTGYLLIASIFHDYCYQYAGYLEIFDGFDKPFFVGVERFRADLMFRRIAHITHPSKEIATNAAHKALRLGGGSAWDECREKEKDAT